MTRRRLAAASASLLTAAVLGAGAPAVGAPAVGAPAVGALAATAAAPAAGLPGYCTTGEGVTVVVDFQELGGGIVVRCAPGPVGSGYSGLDALRDAGFTPTGVRQYGLAFVCRIENKPSADQALPIQGDPGYHESCEHTPPQQAFWGYWYAPNGGRWTYSDEGAINHDALRGGFEGWSFSLNHPAGQSPQPGVAPKRPPQAPPTSPPPTSPPTHQPPTHPPTHRPPTDKPPTHQGPTHGPSTAPRPSHPQPSRPLSTRHPATQPSIPISTAATGATRPTGSALTSAGAGRPSGAGAVPALPTGSSTGVADPVAVGHNAAGEQVSGQLPTADGPDGGSAGTAALGLGVVALLAAGGGVAAWRRRAARE